MHFRVGVLGEFQLVQGDGGMEGLIIDDTYHAICFPGEKH